MIDLSYIKKFYPSHIANDQRFDKHLVKEYVELMAMDFLSATEYIKKLTFIGGTNLRLVKGIDRFSEDIDFDCKDMNEAEFVEMTDALIDFFKSSGLVAEARDKISNRLTAFRKSIYFPKLLFDLGLTAHREQRFLLKVEAQDQGVNYESQTVRIDRCGFAFQILVPPDDVLLSMKLSALISRAKGRDFYDTMFLWQMTDPNYTFLEKRVGIPNREALLSELSAKLADIDMEMKIKDFEHLLFNPHNARRTLQFINFLCTK